MTNTYYDGSTDTVIRIGRAADDYLHGETLPEGGARLEICSYDLMLAYDLTEHGRQFLADWLHPESRQRIAQLVAANNQVAAINADLTERVADLEAKLAAFPPEAIALANHIWRKQRAEPEPQSNP